MASLKSLGMAFYALTTTLLDCPPPFFWLAITQSSRVPIKVTFLSWPCLILVPLPPANLHVHPVLSLI